MVPDQVITVDEEMQFHRLGFINIYIRILTACQEEAGKSFPLTA
jgi:hypothetical protein